MIRKLTFILFLITCCHFTNAQVREVKSRATNHKSSNNQSSSDYSASGDSDDFFFMFDLLFEMFNPMIRGINQAQKRQLLFAEEENWRKGFEFKLKSGIGINNVDFFNSQSIRGNYGLFSTQLRRFNVNDVSGSFTTLDWQIIQLNLINTDRVRWILGAGFSHEADIKQDHFEWSSELYVSILKKKLVPVISYRRSGNGYPRKEFSVFLEYRPFRDKKTEFAFNAGFLRQKLYNVPFNFASIGISFYVK